MSSQEWGDIFVSKHHYALELSKKNIIWFLNSGFRKKLGKFVSVNSVSNNLFIIDYFYLYYGLNKLPFFIIKLLNYLISKAIKKKIGEIDVVLSFEQTRFFNLNLFNAKYKIFLPFDYIPSYPEFEKKVADSADIIISVSDEILKNIKSATPKVKINHGLFIPANNIEIPFVIKMNKEKVNVAYVGTLNHGHIDRENFLNIVQSNQKCVFHIIGPYNEPKVKNMDYFNFFKQLSSFNNIYFHGVIDKETLFSVLKSFDIFFTCYDWMNNPIRISNSHKVLEYLYTGKVTITNFFSAYKGVPEEILIMPRSNNDIAQIISQVSKNLSYYNSQANMIKRKEFAMQYTYEKNILRIEQVINERSYDR
ncbi:MAG: hypothetical protein OEM46_00275 [Ignavibacteria bacterium]|nr:hypothetical protein [Ignavibacteria bacterium]